MPILSVVYFDTATSRDTFCIVASNINNFNLAFSFIKIQTDQKGTKGKFCQDNNTGKSHYIKFQQYHGKDGQIKHPIVDVPTSLILYYDRAVSK